MKRLIISLFIAVILIGTLSACGDDKDNSSTASGLINGANQQGKQQEQADESTENFFNDPNIEIQGRVQIDDPDEKGIPIERTDEP